MQTCNVPAAWLQRVRCQALLRALFRALFRDTESRTYILSSNGVYDHDSDPHLQLQCQYHTSHTRSIMGRGNIFKEGDGSAGIATIRTRYNHHTGSAGTKDQEMHPPRDKASSIKCTWRKSNNCTPRTAKSASKEMMAKSVTHQSSSCMSKLRTPMRTRLSISDPD